MGPFPTPPGAIKRERERDTARNGKDKSDRKSSTIYPSIFRRMRPPAGCCPWDQCTDHESRQQQQQQQKVMKKYLSIKYLSLFYVFHRLARTREPTLDAIWSGERPRGHGRHETRTREREKYNLFDFVFMMIYLIDINTPTVPRADRLATCILFSFLSFSFSVLFFSFVLALQCPVLSR